ncbi:MAG: peroxisomal assembly protein [Icmadophila ericetorum]|nr:peroxisomal assembly protein [Icmadophila ericetorum]
MNETNGTMEHRKKRRRRAHKTPIAARLLLHGHGKGDVGTIPQDLFEDLFGIMKDADEIKHIAITPWSTPTQHLLEDAPWTILPIKVRENSQPGNRTVRVPLSSSALQGFAKTVQAGNGFLGADAGFEVWVLDVQPLQLQTICVKVDRDALQKHEEVQKKFGGGFQSERSAIKGKGRTKSIDGGMNGRTETSDQQTRLKAAIRESLAASMVIHKGDLLPLPLPSHPITHVPLPPIKVFLCEPVDQGFVNAKTQILIDMVSSKEISRRRTALSAKGKSLQRLTVDQDDDTATEFFSAVEGSQSTKDSGSSSSGSGSESDSSEADDSSDNMIALASPTLPSPSFGMSSTPRTAFSRTNGIETPGSVFSNYTATTIRQGKESTGKAFRTKALLRKIPDDILHPSPSNEEDEEARVFVDIKMLVRLGCFAGDWVRISSKAKDGWTVGTFGDDEEEDFRTAKIYGLTDLSPKVVAPPKATPARRYSVSQPPNRPVPDVYLSPVLLANLGNPRQIRISVLTVQDGRRRTKIESSSIPPIAKEITLLRLATPLSTERAIQVGIFAGLKQHFDGRRRILRKGDLIGISIDIDIARICSENADAGSNNEDFLASSHSEEQTTRKPGVAWFKVGQILQSDDQPEDEKWGVVSVEPMTTRMIQAGVEQSKVPASLDNHWEYYLGVNQLPRSATSTVGEPPRSYVQPLRRRIRELIAVATNHPAFHLDMKPIVILLHSTQRSIGKAYLASKACADLGLHLFSIDAYDLLTEGGTGNADVVSLKARIDRAMSCGAEFTVPLIRHLEALDSDRMVSALKDVVQSVKAIVMATTAIDKIPDGIRGLFTHELEVSAPDEGEREGILREVVQARGLRLAYDVDLAAIAVKTAALVAGDLVDVVERALVARQTRLETVSKQQSLNPNDSVLLRDLFVSGGLTAQCTSKADFEIAVETARKNFADAIGAPKIPNVSWDDVGGLANVKDAVMETIQLPLERPELFAKGMKKRSGILFYGPPGTGKTLLAKAIATEFSLNFFSVKGPELLNMYIGESEANVRRVFQRARDARPCVVFFDELDSVAPKRGNQGDSGGVMDRIVSQLLAELDGMSDGNEGGGVFVIGATNRPDLLDQALLRPGRFDKMLYLGVSDTDDKQLTILEALTRKFTLHPDMSLRRVAESLPFTYTGADLYALCSDAMLKAITRQAEIVDGKIKAMPTKISTAYFFDHFATEEDVAVMVTEEDFFEAQKELIGSVSAKELEHYQRIRRQFEGPATISSTSAPAPAPAPPTASPNPTNPTLRINGISGNTTLPTRPHPKSRSNTTIKTSATTPETTGKGGKGKAPVPPGWTSSPDEESESDDSDEAYVTSNDFGPGTPERKANGNGNGNGKGKGKAVMRYDDGDSFGFGFGDGVVGDEEEKLYGDGGD